MCACILLLQFLHVHISRSVSKTEFNKLWGIFYFTRLRNQQNEICCNTRLCKIKDYTRLIYITSLQLNCNKCCSSDQHQLPITVIERTSDKRGADMLPKIRNRNAHWSMSGLLLCVMVLICMVNVLLADLQMGKFYE